MNQWRQISVVLLTLGGISYGLTLVVAAVVALPVWGLALMSVALWGLLVYGFNRWWWRSPLWRRWVSDAPTIGGMWDVKIISQYQGNSRIVPAIIHIEQRWLTMRVILQGENTTSTSITTAISVHQNQHVLSYIYVVTPQDPTRNDRPHVGLTVLRYTHDDELVGYYHYLYQDDHEDRFVRGQMMLTRRSMTAPALLSR